MADERVLARIEAWVSGGLIDEATAGRLRAAEAGADAGGVETRQAPGAGSPSVLFGPGISVGEMFAYLGGAFLIAAWMALIGRLASEVSGSDFLWALGAGAVGVVLGVLAIRLRHGTPRLRRAAGVGFLASAAAMGGAAYVVVDALLNQGRGVEVAGDAASPQLAGAGVWLAFALVYRRLHPSLLTQSGLIVAIVALAAAVMRLLDPLLFGARSFEATGPEGDSALRVVLMAVGWGVTAVVLGLIGLREARPGAPGSSPRAAVTRFAAGLTAVLGTASAVLESGYLGDGEYGRLIEPVVGAVALILVSVVLLERAFRRDSTAFVYPAALGMIIGLSDLNASYLAGASGAELALLVEGVILLGAGFGFDRLRRRVARPEQPARRDEAAVAGPPAAAPAELADATSAVPPA